MSTPALRALRALYPNAHIALLARPYVMPIYEAAPWFDEIIPCDLHGAHAGLRGLLRLAGHLRSQRFDLAVILPNSFGSALLMLLAGVPRRVGYRRDGRGWLLTDALEPFRSGGRIIPRNMVDYYFELCHYLGARNCERRVELFTTPEAERSACEILAKTNADRPLVGLNPGGAFGSSKLWPAERFAALSDILVERLGTQCILFAAPSEVDIAQRVLASARHPILWPGPQHLSTVKSLIRRCRLLVTNDTGARHIAVAFDRPVVVLMGATSSLYTDANLDKTIIVRKRVHCGPCQKKHCTLDHRCMRAITVEDVMRAVERLWNASHRMG